jgi:hypothetical protein
MWSPTGRPGLYSAQTPCRGAYGSGELTVAGIKALTLDVIVIEQLTFALVAGQMAGMSLARSKQAYGKCRRRALPRKLYGRSLTMERALHRRCNRACEPSNG